MRLISLRARGIGRFTEEVELPINKLGEEDRLVAVIGHNGSGKSTMLGLLHASWYGKVPGYGLLTHMATDRNSHVEQVIDVGGTELISRRVINATARPVKQQAYLSTGGVPQNPNGKIGEYEKLVGELLPSAELHLASAFAAQGGGGRFLDLSRADRRELFATMLGLGRIQALAEVAKLRLKAITLESVKLLASIDALRQVSDMPIGRMIALLDDARLTVEHKAADRIEIEAEQTAVVEAIATWEARREQVAKDSAAITLRCDDTLRDLADVKTRIDHLDKALEAIDKDKIAISETGHDITHLQSVIDENKDVESELALASSELEKAIVLQEGTALRNKEWNSSLFRLEEEHQNNKRIIERVLATVAHQHGINHTKMVAAKEGAALIGNVACEPGSTMQSMCPLLANAISCKESITDLEFRLRAATQSTKDENRNLEALAREKEKALHDLGPEPKLDLYATANPRQQIKHLTERKGVADRAVARKAVLQERLVRIGWNVAQEKSVLAERETATKKRAQIDTSYLELTGQKRKLFAEMDSVIDGQPPENSKEDLALVRREETAARSAVAVLEARIAKAKKDQETIAKMDDDRERTIVQIDDWTALSRALGPEGVQALLIDAAGPEVGDLANSLLSSCYGDRFAVQFTTTRTHANGKGTQEVFDLLVVDNDRGREARAEGFSVGEKILINEALSLAIAIYNTRKSGIEMADLVRDECSGALHVDIAPLYVAMLRKALDVGGFNRCYFITHQQELVDLADAVFEFHDGKID